MAVRTTHELADFLASVTVGDLPADVTRESVRVTFDTVTCAIAAQRAPGSHIVAETMLSLENGPGQATILGLNRTANPAGAAFVNATAANALDLDDNLLYHCHIANTVVAAAIAAAEHVDADGADLLAAIAVGYEAAARITLCMPGVQYVEDSPDGPQLKEWHDPWGYSYNTIGGAVAAARLYGADAERMRHVIGLAAYASPVPSGTRASSLGRHPMSKYGAYGWQAASALTSATLGANGYTADDHVFDGPFGYGRMVGAPFFESSTLVRDLGRRWWLPLTSYKLVPAGTWMRPALFALTPLLTRPDFDPATIDQVEIQTRPLRAGGEGANVFASGRPHSYNDTQVSYRYLVAVTLLGVPPDKWQTPEVFRRPDVNALIDRTTILPDPEVDQLILADLAEFPHRPRGARTRVRVRFRDGTEFNHEASYGDGDPFSPETRITDDKLRRKFRTFAAPGLSDGPGADAVEADLWALSERRVRDVTATMRAASASPATVQSVRSNGKG